MGVLLEAAGDGGRAHGCEQVGGVRLDAPDAVYGPVILGPGLFVVQWGHPQGGSSALVCILRGASGKVGDGEADVYGAMACGSQREGSISGLRPDDGGGVAIAYVDAGGGGICLVAEVGWLAFEVGHQVHEPVGFRWCCGLQGAGVWPVPLGPPRWGRRSCRR